jgi:hypothetical protein
MNKEEMVKALKTLKQIFDKHHILFWLDAGTLIGAAREGQIIPWDDDIDVCTWIKDAENIALARKDFEGTDYELYVIPLHIPTYGFGHYAIRHRKTKKHLVCILAAYNSKNHVVRARVLPVVNNIIRFFHMLRCDRICNLSWKLIVQLRLYKDMVVRYPVDYFGTPSTMNFYGEEFSVPGNVDKCLSFMYGNWKIPKKNTRYDNRKLLRDIK